MFPCVAMPHTFFYCAHLSSPRQGCQPLMPTSHRKEGRRLVGAAGIKVLVESEGAGAHLHRAGAPRNLSPISKKLHIWIWCEKCGHV